MGRSLYHSSAAARAVFDEADAALGFAISAVCFDGSEEDLRLTANTQPAILTVSVAAYRAFLEAGAEPPSYAAGHSLGEYSALVAAGVITLADAVRLVRARGEFMQEAVPPGEGAMAAVLGGDREAIEAACAAAALDKVCAPANFNCPGQVVIAGSREAVERAGSEARRLGAKKIVPLEVSAPFHTSLMAPAAERLRPLLDAVDFADPRFPVVTNVTARMVRTGAEAREMLAAQVAAPVLWEDSVRTLVAAGVTRFVEMGPGKVLTGLVRKIDRGVSCVSVSGPEEILAALSADTAG
jgi:[acyl-carrier-protein] S-malonyltransferase